MKALDKPVQRRIIAFLEKEIETEFDPKRHGRALEGPLKGLWRYRVSDYRIVCEIQSKAVRMLVVKVGHRREIYR